MDDKAFQNPNGELITANGYSLFVPTPLPPSVSYSNRVAYEISDSHIRLSRLAGIGQLLPSPQILIASYLRREAVLSSRIEGNQASLSDLFLYELVGEGSFEDTYTRVKEVRNYVRALELCLGRIRRRRQRIDLDMIRTAHRILLQGVRRAERNPGQFRKVQNWIGAPGSKIEDAVYVPPGPEHLATAMKDIEQFIQNPPDEMPVLVQCAVLHYQFESVHPFVDGNGRIGRLLITLFLCEKKILPHGLLYLSQYLEQNKTEYFDRLLGVSQRNEWSEWVEFFLKGVSLQSSETIGNVQKLLDLRNRYEDKLRRRHATQRAHLLTDGLFSNPYTTVKNASEFLKVTFVTAQATINVLVNEEILIEMTKRK